MKKILTFLFLLPVSGLLAQPVISSPPLSGLIGSVYSVTPADTTITMKELIGSSGPGIVWDLSGMAVYSGYAYVVSVLSTDSDTLALNTYPPANIELDGPNNIEYENLTDTACVVYGNYNASEYTIYRKGDEEIRYPVTFGSSWTSSYAGYEYSPPVTLTDSFSVSGSRLVIADGWGTLITPYDTFPNVIRLAAFGQSAYNFYGDLQTIYDTTFIWIEQGQIAPILSFTYSALTAGDSTVLSEYTLLLQSSTDTVTGIKQAPKQTSLTVFPNPANDLINVRLSIEPVSNCQVSIYDVTGRLYKQEDIDNNSNIQIVTADLPSGYYLGVIIDETGNENRFRFVKQ